MGITKLEELVAWQAGNKIICPGCGDPGEAKPLTKADFADDDIVTCDDCGERIL